ncbi:type II toxin-antitoxin system RelB/DinJ family antitoxin [Patescibacteria group bacterium]|nr:type II toxin-antitoxin system RelB/DinJ family antitoxin [Patescibacteria group bacterium]MBU4022794.1 type II toxin-antitoxin system RelB/DinJ family antitoxin [Patescibacteria group bacterium]MBU4162376.1 type II toxin-antitoxin system RelB/DinJ family antitoxin [Patescibacteria group bacterium]
MKTVINIKTNSEIKEAAQETAKELGLSLSTVINAYLRQFVRDKEAYFGVAPKMLPELENLLGSIEFDIQRNKNVSRSFSSKQELKKHFSSS